VGLGAARTRGFKTEFGEAQDALDDVPADVDVLNPVKRDLPFSSGEDAGADVERVVGEFVLEAAVVGDGVAHDAHRNHEAEADREGSAEGTLDDTECGRPDEQR